MDLALTSFNEEHEVVLTFSIILLDDPRLRLLELDFGSANNVVQEVDAFLGQVFLFDDFVVEV